MIYDEQLGAGKFGPVYLAEWSRDQQMEKLVTVKTLTDGATAAERVLFLQEAAILAQFRHPNLVALYGVSHRDQNVSYFSLTCSPGLTLIYRVLYGSSL